MTLYKLIAPLKRWSMSLSRSFNCTVDTCFGDILEDILTGSALGGLYVS